MLQKAEDDLDISFKGMMKKAAEGWAAESPQGSSSHSQVLTGFAIFQRGAFARGTRRFVRGATSLSSAERCFSACNVPGHSSPHRDGVQYSLSLLFSNSLHQADASGFTRSVRT